MHRFKEMLLEGRFPLVMSLPANDPALARVAWDAGADVVKVHINVKHRASQTLFGGLDVERGPIEAMLADAGGPMGIVLGTACDVAEGALPEAVSLGFDFLSLYGHHATPAVMGAGGIDKMIAPDYSWADWEVAGLEAAGADVLEASVMDPDSYGQRLSVRELVRYRHLHELCGLPMVVPTQRAVRPSELPALREAGAAAIMIGAVVTGRDEAGIAAAVEAFRAEIDRMRG